MATSSITENFVISGKEQVERFIAALEAAEEDLKKNPRKRVECHMAEGKELEELMKKWEAFHAGEE